MNGILALLLFSAVACDDILDVSNPGAIEEGELTDPALEQTMINGVIGEFQYTHSYASQWTGTVADELLLDHTYAQTIPMVLRTLDEDNVYVNNIYSFWQRSRASADDAVDRLQVIHGDDAMAKLNMLKALAYGGYSYVLMGETFCEVPINMSAPYSPAEFFEMAVERFEQALEVADNALEAGEPSAQVEQLRNLAYLGAARASLNLGEMGDAEAYASNVDEDFEMWIRHSENSGRQYNPFHNPTTGANNRYLSPGLPFQNLDDIRVPHTAEKLTSLVEGTMMYIPYQPYSFSEWTPEDSLEFQRSTDIRFASALEARYIIAEAQGATDYTLNLVNDRRQFVGHDEVTLDGDALMAELREQRARDFYLTGKRFGDLRRYKNLYGIDLFPSGTDPFQDLPYGDVTCLPIPQSERNSNPNF
ncbi:MAG: RagB/SusD family nutrient uptake outer membrane protein [Bacteroidota bacterium]